MKYLIFFIILIFNPSFSQLIPKIETYENGNVKTIIYLKNDANKLIKIKTENYFASGQLESLINFKNNQKHGEYVSFWENGEISSRGFFNDGKMDSLWNFWDRKGNIEGTSNWSKDLKHGKWTAFYNSGQIKQESIFKKETWRVSNSNTIKMEVKHYMPNGQMAKDAGLGNIGIKTGPW